MGRPKPTHTGHTNDAVINDPFASFEAYCRANGIVDSRTVQALYARQKQQ